MNLRKKHNAFIAAVWLLLALVTFIGTDGFSQEEPPVTDKTLSAIRRQMDNGQGAVGIDETGGEFGENVPSLREIITRLIYSLVVVVFILVIALYFLRKFLKIRAPGSSQYIHIISQASLSPKSSLHLVRVSDKRLLIGEGPDGVRFIAEIPETEGDPLEEEYPPKSSPDAANTFRRNLQGEVTDVQQGMLLERVQNVVKNCRDYLGKLKQGSGRNG